MKISFNRFKAMFIQYIRETDDVDKLLELVMNMQIYIKNNEDNLRATEKRR